MKTHDRTEFPHLVISRSFLTVQGNYGRPLRALNGNLRHNSMSHTLGHTMDGVRSIVQLRLSFPGNEVSCYGLVFWSTCLENQRVRDGCNHRTLLLLFSLAWLSWSGVLAVRVIRPRAMDCSGNVCARVTLSHLAMNAAVMLLVGKVSERRASSR